VIVLVFNILRITETYTIFT